MRDRIKNIILRSAELIAILVVVCLVLIFVLAQGIVLSNVINIMRVDTYITPIIGAELVFLILSLVWIPAWCLVAYNKKR